LKLELSFLVLGLLMLLITAWWIICDN